LGASLARLHHVEQWQGKTEAAESAQEVPAFEPERFHH
jgi:hypothetical protein